MDTKYINFVCGPRNISTAIMYSFAQRTDTQVLDEPWYAAYLQQSGAIHPGRDEILTSQSTDPLVVWQEIKDLREKPIVFLKNMAHHMHGLSAELWTEYEHVFLIRNPHDLITSFAKVIPSPQMKDIGIKDEWELYEQICAEREFPPAVIDSGELLKAPEQVMNKLCDILDIPFQKEMLSWDKCGRPEDGIWAKHWYSNVHQSTGFALQRKKPRPMPTHCENLYQEALPFYKALFEKSIKA